MVNGLPSRILAWLSMSDPGGAGARDVRWSAAGIVPVGRYARRMAAPLALLALLAACTPPPAQEGPIDDGDDTAPGEDAPADCAAPTISWTGDAVPGAVLELRVDAGADHDLFRWEVEAGDLSAEEGAAVAWTVPADAAEEKAETLDVAVVASGDRCDATGAAAEVEVDWPEADRVLVLYNPAVEGSEEVALRYADFRGVDRLCGVAASDTTTLAGADFPAWVADVQACLDEAGAQVQYIVPVYGVPYKVTERIASIADGAPVTTSLDALLVLGGEGVSASQAEWNPLWQEGDSPTGTYAPYVPVGTLLHRQRTERWLVTRIDGADAQAALDLVDRTEAAEALAAAGELAGTVYVDGQYGDTPPATDEFGSYESGEWNMWGTRAVFEDLAWYPVVWDGLATEFGTAPSPTACPDALYYAGWYSFDNYNDAFTWAPGAVGGHLDSCSACDLRQKSWSGEALKRGITATFGAVNEPYVAGMPEYDQLFLYLTQGANFAEAAYESTRVGLWMMVFVGDPLYRPHPSAAP